MIFRSPRLDGPEGRPPQRGEPPVRVAAAKEALADSGFELTERNRTEVGVVFGSGGGGQRLMVDNSAALRERGPRAASKTCAASVDAAPPVGPGGLASAATHRRSSRVRRLHRLRPISPSQRPTARNGIAAWMTSGPGLLSCPL